MATVLKGSPISIEGAGVCTHTVSVPGDYFVSVQSTVVPPSNLSITIAQTGSASVSVSSASLAAAQSHVELQKDFNCAAADVITITITTADSANRDNSLIILTRKY